MHHFDEIGLLGARLSRAAHAMWQAEEERLWRAALPAMILPIGAAGMKQYILRRVGYSLVSLFLLSLVIFLFVRVTGDPMSLLVEPGASPEDIETMRRQFGLDRPLWEQYGHFMASLVGGRSRPVLLLSHAGDGSLFAAPAQFAAAGGGGDGPVAADRHPERHPGRGEGRRVLGQRGQDLRPARLVVAVRSGSDWC